MAPSEEWTAPRCKGERTALCIVENADACNFKISATRHGVINREEFGDKICRAFCTANEGTKCAENFAQCFAQFFTQTSARVIQNCRRNFALGNVRRDLFPAGTVTSLQRSEVVGLSAIL